MFVQDCSNQTDKPVIIIGAGEHGRMMNSFFRKNTALDVRAFVVESRYNCSGKVDDLPVVNFEDILNIYPPEFFRVFVAVTFVNLNKERKRLFETVKALGYEFISYIDPSSVIGDNVVVGENVAVFENNVIQYNCTIGSNTVIQAGGGSST